jgi:hypothetical protein
MAILALGIYFGRERALFCDSTMQLYDMASRGIPRVNPSMLATVINFILPYLAIVTGMSVKVIVYALAINYLLLPLAVFMFLRYKQTSLRYELAFLVTFTLFNWNTFYYPIHDYWTGLFFLFILYRLVDDPDLAMKGKRKMIFEYLLIAGMMFTHLSIVIALGFLYVYLYIEKRLSVRKLVLVYAYVFLILLLKVFFVNSGYQNTLLDPATMLSNGVWGIFQTTTMYEFMGSLLKTNVNFVILGIVSVLLAVYRKQFPAAILFLFIFLVSLVVINLLFPGYGYSIYTEGYFKSTTLVCGIIMSNFIYGFLSGGIAPTALLAVNYIFSGIVLWSGGSNIRDQFDFVSKSCRKFSTSVYLRSNKDICPLEFIVLSRQSILINQLENNSGNSIFVSVGGDPYVENLNRKYLRDDREKPVRLFSSSGELVYLDADSMGIELEQYPILFKNKNCDEMIRRLDQ